MKHHRQEAGGVLSTQVRETESKWNLAALEQLSRERYISSYDRAVICCGLGDIDQALAYLTMAYEEKNQDLGVAHVDPRLDRLHSDVRFTELLAKIGLELGVPPV